MEESGYLANILRDRGCPLCGTDRQRVVSPRAGKGGGCHEDLGPEDLLLAAGTRGGHAAGPEAPLQIPPRVRHGRSTMADPTVAIERLRKSYGDTPALRDLSLVAFPGEIVGLIGPNGAGKTPTIKIL